MAPKGFPTTTETVARTLILGGDPDAPFRIPILSGDFRDAPDLKRIGDALIAACEELEDLKWAIEEDGFTIAYVWKKKASKSADRFVLGAQGKPGGLAKHFATEAKGARVGYTVTLAADANRGQTNWQIEARVFHELYHCKIARKVVGKGEDRRTVPVLKVRGHDLEMFWAERRRYGDWHSALAKGAEVFAQTTLPMERPGKATAPNVAAEAVRAVMTNGAGQAFVDTYAESDTPVTLSAVVDGERVEIGPQNASRKSPKNRSEAQTPGSEGLGVSCEKPHSEPHDASGAISHNGQVATGNGAHDRDDAAGVLLDPDRVCRLLAERGWKIAYQQAFDGAEGLYVDAETFVEYDLGDVESAYRAALAGRA